MLQEQRPIGQIIFFTDSPEFWRSELAVRANFHTSNLSLSERPTPPTFPEVVAMGKLPQYIRPSYHNTLQYRVCGTPEAVANVLYWQLPATSIKFDSLQQLADSGVPERRGVYGGTAPVQMVIIDRPICDTDLDFSDERRIYVLLDSQKETEPSQVDERKIEQVVCLQKYHTSPTLYEVEDGDGDWLVGFKSIERLLGGMEKLRSGLQDHHAEATSVVQVLEDTEATLRREFLPDASWVEYNNSDLRTAVRLSHNDASIAKQRVITQLLARLEPLIATQTERTRVRLEFVDELRAQDSSRMQLLRLIPSALGIPGAFQADLEHHLAEAGQVFGEMTAMRTKVSEVHAWLVANRARVVAGGDVYFVELYDAYLARLGQLATN